MKTLADIKLSAANGEVYGEDMEFIFNAFDEIQKASTRIAQISGASNQRHLPRCTEMDAINFLANGITKIIGGCHKSKA